MYHVSLALRELQTGINMGRLRLAEQFATMEGWQSSHSTRFDAYVKEKRQKHYFDAFDQRVERAYNVAAKAHKTEVLNSLKRRLKSKDEKFTAATMLEMRGAVEDRLRWLRDVWSQIDADYRSNDSARQEVAAKEISAALHGEPGDYMKWVYDLKREERFAGEKQKAALKAEMEGAELPEVSDEEANRYHNLRLNMAEIERNVVNKYGVAGQQHWAELQAAKDDLYERKLDEAAEIYKELLDQSSRYDESRRTALLRSNVERVHEAQVRFKASIEMEAEREKMLEAHNAMKEQRKLLAKEQRVQLLKEAAELKAQGRGSAEVASILRERQLEQHARRQAEYQLREQENVLQKKSAYLKMIDEFRQGVEEREGRELLAQRQPSSVAAGGKARNVFGFADADRIEEDGVAAYNTNSSFSQEGTSGDGSSSMTARQQEGEALAAAAGSTDTYGMMTVQERQAQREQQRQLWQAIKKDKYEDPFATVHQARLDAAKYHDPIYAQTFPLNLKQGKKYGRQGMGEMAAGNEMDRQIAQMGRRNTSKYVAWGVHSPITHDLDGDGDTDYMVATAWHVRDKETGDIDWRYEKKKGGAVFRGPRFYRIGAERDAADPGERTMDPHPPTEHEKQLARQKKSRNSGGGGVLPPGGPANWRSS